MNPEAMNHIDKILDAYNCGKISRTQMKRNLLFLLEKSGDIPKSKAQPLKPIPLRPKPSKNKP
jgi:hypothetical protein